MFFLNTIMCPKLEPGKVWFHKEITGKNSKTSLFISMKKYVAFDFDGTLVDSRELFVNSYNQVAQKYNFRQLTPQNIPELQALSLLERFRAMEIPLYKVPFLTAAFLKIYRKSTEYLTLYTGISEVLLALKEQGFTVAVISSNEVATIKSFLQRHNLEHIMHIYCSTNLFGKDRVIRNFMRKYKLHENDLIYIGDELRDIEACKKNNVKVVWVNWGFETEKSIGTTKPDYIATNPRDILKIVRSNFVKLLV